MDLLFPCPTFCVVFPWPVFSFPCSLLVPKFDDLEDGISDSILLFNPVAPYSLCSLKFTPLTLAETFPSTVPASWVADNKSLYVISSCFLRKYMELQAADLFCFLLSQQVELLLKFICSRGLTNLSSTWSKISIRSAWNPMNPFSSTSPLTDLVISDCTASSVWEFNAL